MAAELKAIAKLDGKNFEAGINRIKGKTDSFANKLSGMKSMIAGAFAVGAITAFGRKMLKTADDLQTAANIFGTTMETMLAFQSVMAESGIGADRFNKIFGRIKTMQADVSAGLKTYTRELDKMNISQAEIKGLGVDEVFLLLAKRYGEATDKGEFLEAMTKLLGTRLIELVEVFQRVNKEGMGKFREEAAGAAEGMTNLAVASDYLEGFMNKVTIKTANLVGWMVALKEATVAAATAMRDWAEQNIIEKAGAGIAKGILKLTGKFDQDIFDKSVSRVTGRDKQADNVPLWERVKKAVLDSFAEVKLPKAGRTGAGGDLAPGPGAGAATPQESMATYRKMIDSDKKIASEYEKMTGTVADYYNKRADILAGKGVGAPRMASVDSLQSIGGIVGGVAGAGDQTARIAERQAKAGEMMAELIKDSNQKLKDIEDSIKELGEG